MKIKQIQTLIGVFHDSTKSVDCVKHKAELTLVDFIGVLVKRSGYGSILVPFQNITWMQVDEGSEAVGKEIKKVA